MSRKIVIGVGIANYPLNAAGNSWAFLQWALAFRDAGWEVWLVEQLTSKKCINASGQPCAPAESANLKHWRDFLSEFNFFENASLLVDGECSNLPQLKKFASSADLFLNISGHFREKQIISLPKKKLYLDLDPVFTQVWAEAYNVDMNFEGHDCFITVGGLLGTSKCNAPALGKKWISTLPPVSLEYWNFSQANTTDAPWTTVTHWYGYPAIEYKGQWYSNKSEEFEKIINLPSLTSQKLELATDLTSKDDEFIRFSKSGWLMREAAPLNSPWQTYRDYLANSKGEFCVAKNGYVKGNSGWFSDRSVCYLALGRPVVLQETGWSDVLPSGDGLLPFTDSASAVAALNKVTENYAQHSLAARKIAETFLAGPKVVEKLLIALGK